MPIVFKRKGIITVINTMVSGSERVMVDSDAKNTAFGTDRAEFTHIRNFGCIAAEGFLSHVAGQVEIASLIQEQFTVPMIFSI